MGFQVGDPQERKGLIWDLPQVLGHTVSLPFLVSFFFCAPNRTKGVVLLALRTRPLEELQEHLANIRSLGQGLSISKMALAEWGKMMGKMVLTKDCFFWMFLNERSIEQRFFRCTFPLLGKGLAGKC